MEKVKKEMIKVLWIDDQNLSTFIDHADLIGIDITRKPSWNSGMSYLKANYDIIDAIILDCYCPLEDNGPEDKRFLGEATKELYRLSEEKKRQIPWYVLSKGAPSAMGECGDFGTIIELSIENRRKELEGSWGKTCYVKGNREDHKLLLESIKKSVENSSNFWIRNKYSDVFKSADALGLEQTNELQQILKALHFPEEMPGFDPNLYYNRLRIIVEYFFRVCMHYELIPKEVGCDTNDNVANSECSSFFSGREPRHHPGARLPNGVEYPEAIAYILWNIIKGGNKNSHSTDVYDMYVVDDADMHYSLYGFALQLCDAIRWLHKYISEPYPKLKLDNNNNNVFVYNINTINQHRLDKYKEEYLNKKWLVEKTGNVYYCGKCYLGINREYELILGKEIWLQEVHFTPASNDTNKYPISSDYKISESDVYCRDFDNLYFDQDGFDIHEERFGEIIKEIYDLAMSDKAGGMIRIGVNELGPTGLKEEMKAVDRTFQDFEKELISFFQSNNIKDPNNFLFFPSNTDDFLTIFVFHAHN